jgi:hypothetical protein
MSASKQNDGALDSTIKTIRFLWRWHSGYPLHGPHGKFRTDASWSQDYTKVLHPTGYANWWHKMRFRRRGLIRSTATYITLTILYGLLTAPAITIPVTAVTAAAAAAYGIWRAVMKIRTREDRRDAILPLEDRLRHLTGRRPDEVTIERNKDGEIEAVQMIWPQEAQIASRDQPLILEAIKDRLAIEAPVPDKANFKGRNRVTRYTRADPPPSFTTWPDIDPAVAKAGPNDIIFGLGSAGITISASLSSDSPHLACSGGSGGGKSNAGAVIILQELRRGAILFNIDPRWDSHLWAEGLPNVIAAHEICDVHNALAWLGEELHRRYKITYYASRGGVPDRRKRGPRLLVNCEELNFGMADLKDYWSDCRAEDKSLPKRSPALKALQACSCAGRAVDIHLMLWAQMLTAESTGVKDSTVRTNAGIKLMVRYDANNWNMQIGKRFPMPPEPSNPGRIQLVTARGVQECQVPYLALDKDDSEGRKAVAWAREFAVSGEVAALPTGDTGIPPSLWPVPIAEPVLGQQALPPGAGQSTETVRTVLTETPPAPEEPVTLSEACDEETGFLTCGLIAARRASTRPGFPAHVGQRGKARNAPKLYRPADLRAHWSHLAATDSDGNERTA